MSQYPGETTNSGLLRSSEASEVRIPNQQDYTCPICEFVAPHREELTLHLRMVHSEDTLYNSLNHHNSWFSLWEVND